MTKTRIRKKKLIDANVYEQALDRLRYLYSIYDDVVVSFSGGKDSTALLLCTIDVAKELDRLPVRTVFYDEEALHPPTVEYVQRVSEMPEVDLEWYCLPIQHRNACSNDQPFWHPWHPDESDIWVRPMPDGAITDHPRFEMGQSMQDFGIAHFSRMNVAVVQGIRTQESIRRYRAVANKKDENFITRSGSTTFAYPIYDWTSEDVWKLVQIKGADYNRTYDIFNRTDWHGHLFHQRVCPPFGEEPLRGLWVYAECWPELWHKMINRVPGAATAARYGNTELYSQGYKPDQTSYREHVKNMIDTYSGEHHQAVIKAVNGVIRAHNKLTANKVPENQPHPLTGLSWKLISKMVTRGDFKGRVAQLLSQEAHKAQIAMGITKAEAVRRYGRKAS